MKIIPPQTFRLYPNGKLFVSMDVSSNLRGLFVFFFCFFTGGQTFILAQWILFCFAHDTLPVRNTSVQSLGDFDLAFNCSSFTGQTMVETDLKSPPSPKPQVLPNLKNTTLHAVRKKTSFKFGSTKLLAGYAR